MVSGYLMSVLGGMVGLVIGNHLLSYDQTLSGEKIYRFNAQSRRHGKIMVVLASAVIFFCLIFNVSLKV